MTTPGRGAEDGNAGVLGRALDHDFRYRCVGELALRCSRTLMSSSSMLEKFLVFAYQRELQLRLSANRKPIGFILAHLSFSPVADRDHDIARRLHDARAAAFGLGAEAPQEGAALDADARD